jgi:AcrR family transcriptional regulator
VLRDGVAKLTLDAVAAEAGASKGGILYHFPTKNALIEAMITAWMEGFDALHQQAYEADTQMPGRWLRAYIRACADDPSVAEKGEFGSGLLAAVSTTPELMNVVRAKFAQYQQQAVQDGIDAATATAIRLAADGLWLADLFGLEPPAPALREQVVARLLELAAPQR